MFGSFCCSFGGGISVYHIRILGMITIQELGNLWKSYLPISWMLMCLADVDGCEGVCKLRDNQFRTSEVTEVTAWSLIDIFGSCMEEFLCPSSCRSMLYCLVVSDDVPIGWRHSINCPPHFSICWTRDSNPLYSQFYVTFDIHMTFLAQQIGSMVLS